MALSGEAATGLGITSVLMAGWSSAEKGVQEARRIRAQNKARIKQMQNQFSLSTQNLHNNNVAINKQRMRNDISIEESKLEGQDAFAQAFAGSGVSGRSVDVLEANMQNEVSKAHNENAQQSIDTKDRQFLGLMRQSDQIKADIKNLNKFDVSANESNINMAMLNAGLSEASSVVKAFA